MNLTAGPPAGTEAPPPVLWGDFRSACQTPWCSFNTCRFLGSRPHSEGLSPRKAVLGHGRGVPSLLGTPELSQRSQKFTCCLQPDQSWLVREGEGQCNSFLHSEVLQSLDTEFMILSFATFDCLSRLCSGYLERWTELLRMWQLPHLLFCLCWWKAWTYGFQWPLQGN